MFPLHETGIFPKNSGIVPPKNRECSFKNPGLFSANSGAPRPKASNQDPPRPKQTNQSQLGFSHQLPPPLPGTNQSRLVFPQQLPPSVHRSNQSPRTSPQKCPPPSLLSCQSPPLFPSQPITRRIPSAIPASLFLKPTNHRAGRPLHPPPPSPLPPPPGTPSGTPGTPSGTPSAPGLGRVLREALERAGEPPVWPCQAELLQGGLGGPNRGRVLGHLLGAWPLLVRYDGDSNHAPCSRRGHRAHWALLIGALGPQFQRDSEIPNIFHARGFGAGGSQNGSGGFSFGFLGSLIEEGPQFGEGSQCHKGLRDLGQGSWFGSGGSQFVSGGSQFGEGSQTEGSPNLESRGSQFGSGGSQCGEGSQAKGALNLSLGAPNWRKGCGI
uniref:Actin maturation protease n=1 Tax=Serinus canaria TaxID=9135 RepID=A0A8C9MKT7_SERCA